MERVEEILKNHEERLDRHQMSIEGLKQNQNDTLRVFEKFQLKSDLLQQRSNEMFLEIKSGLNDTRKMIETFQNEQNDEHYKRPKRRNEDIFKAVIISALSGLVGLLVGLLSQLSF